MIKVYIASPYSGDVNKNVRRQMKTFDTLADEGYAPFIPQLYHFQDLMYPRIYHDWMKLCLEWVTSCDVVLRLKGDSEGADMEGSLAKRSDIPVVYSIEELVGRFPT